MVVNGTPGDPLQEPHTLLKLHFPASNEQPKRGFSLCFSVKLPPPACVHIPIPFLFHSLKLQLLFIQAEVHKHYKKGLVCSLCLCIPSLALQLHMVLPCSHTFRKSISNVSRILYKLSPPLFR